MAPCWGSRNRNRNAGLQLVESYGSERKAEGRATAGWPEGRSIGDDASQRCRRQARRASRFGRSANQIDEKIDEIIDFAEIREFIDMPVQSYSSEIAFAAW